MRVDRAWIEAHIPHHGRMCLLDEVLDWNADFIRSRSGTHRALDHPMRSHGRLGVACGIEYAAQTMAVHGALAASSGGVPPGELPAAGFLAAVRNVRRFVQRLDDVESDLQCTATRIAGDHLSALYDFALSSGADVLLSGRATVILDASKRWIP
jgi:predicted hotdog family 3-hydroxylacyl-ACP dehydratase